MIQATERTTIKRKPDRGRYDRASVHAILDAAFVCHLGFTDAEGRPVVIPTAYGRIDDTLFIHGSPTSRLLRTVKQGIDVCLTVTIIDGLVLARSAFHHSINYRSVVVFGRATEVSDLAEKGRAMRAFVDHVVPGRSAEVRPSDDKELRGTTVLALPITEASAKVRTGPPLDEPRDLDSGIWAGELPTPVVARPPVPAPDLEATIPVPAHVREWAVRFGHG